MKTTLNTPSASPTTTAGFTSSESSQQSLADTILAAAQQHRESRRWFDRLSPELRDVVADVRQRWRATKGNSGVSAAHLARTIIAQMPGCALPRPKELAAWLNSDQ